MIFAGGPGTLVERVQPVLSVLGSAVHVGGPGAGAAAKLVANAALFGTLGTLSEALALAGGLGLSREDAFKVLAATPLAAQAERRRPAVESGRDPPRFPLRLASKDARLIGSAAAAAGVDLRVSPRQSAQAWETGTIRRCWKWSGTLTAGIGRAMGPGRPGGRALPASGGPTTTG